MREFIGKLYRDGECYCKESEVVYDHDFPSLADGILIPHGIFDVTQNKGYISIGQSKDTSEFLVDNIKYHWQNNIIIGKITFKKTIKMLRKCYY